MDPTKLATLLSHITLLKKDLEELDIEIGMHTGIYWSKPYILSHLNTMQLDVYNQLNTLLTKQPEGAILPIPQETSGDQTKI